MRATRSHSPNPPKKGFLNRDVIHQALRLATPEARLTFVVRCGMRIRGLMQHQLVGQGVDHMLSLGRRACLDPKVIDERFVAALKFLKECVEDKEMPGIEDPENRETTPYRVEAVAVARVYDEVRHWHKQDVNNQIWTAGLAAAESEDALRLIDIPDEKKSLWLDTHYRGLMNDLEHAKSGKGTTSYEPFQNGPWGALWPDGTPDWCMEAERARPLTSIQVWHNDFLICNSHMEANWRSLEKILKQMSEVQELRLPPREGHATDASLGEDFVEARASIARVIQLIDANPSLANHLLPSIGEMVRRANDTGQIVRRNEAAEILGVSLSRVNQMAADKVVESTEILGISFYPRISVVKTANTERPHGKKRS